MIMRHLLWKDAMAIKPLMVAVVLGMLGIYAGLILVTGATMTPTTATTFFVSFWILMPNLVALGAPALLVGGEEENGTLGWLRTLPVSWQRVSDSKFIVALAAVAIAWAVSSLLMFIATHLLELGVNPNQGGRYGPTNMRTPFAQDMLRPTGIAYLLFFSGLLLLSGFVTAYTFRSPVAGLIAVVPLIAVLNAVAYESGQWLLTGDRYYQIALGGASMGRYLGIGVLGLLVLAAFWLIQRMLARRRLTSPRTNILKHLPSQDPISAYRPPAIVRTSRPSQTIALLWQQTRQVAPLAIPLTLVIASLLVVMRSPAIQGSSEFWYFISEFASIGIAICGSWLGGLAFYGDNVRKRNAFFSDRGISPTRVWWTRLALPIACAGLLIVLSESLRSVNSTSVVTIVMIVAFAFGQLVGQWMKRPVLTFFMSPAGTAIAAMVLLIVFTFYADYHWTAILAAPVLLFASWRLAGRWLSGDTDYGYQWRAFAYSALSVAVPLVAIFVLRTISTPAVMPQWRSQVMSVKTPTFNSYSNGILFRSNNIMPDAFSAAGLADSFGRATYEVKEELLRQELASEEIGIYVGLDDIRSLLSLSPRNDTELQHAGIEVLLKWATQVREGALEGEYPLIDLDTAAEASEALAVSAISEHLSVFGPTKELKSMVDSIPDADLRLRSRRMALIGEWKAYNRTQWVRQSPGFVNYGKVFAYRPIAHRIARLPFERTRADRFIDQLTQLLLSQLDNGLPDSSYSPGMLKRDELWQQATGPVGRGGGAMPFARTWTKDYERAIESLEKKFK